MRRTNQGGSLAGFIIIGVLLTLVLVGGLYGLNRYNAQRAADETAQSEEPAPEEKTAETETATQTETESSEASPQSRTERDNAAPEQQPRASTSAPQSAATSAQLPQTGPADMFLGIIAISALTFAGVHYARSRA